MTNYHFRNVYEWQCEHLGLMANVSYHSAVIQHFTDTALLRQINQHLKALNCIPFTEEEINSIQLQ